MFPTGAPTHLSTFLDNDLDPTALIVSTLLVLLFGSLFSVAYSTSITKKKHDEKKYAKPWPKVEGALPFIGNAHQLEGLKQLPKTLHGWADKYSKEHGCFSLDLGGTNWVVVCRADRMKEVMDQRPNVIMRSEYQKEAARSIRGGGTFAQEGAEWKKQRAVLASMFNKSHIRDYMKYTKLVAGRLMVKWEGLAAKSGPQGFGVNQDISKYVTDSASLSLLGKDSNTLNKSDTTIEDLSKAFDSMVVRQLSPIQFWKIPFIGQYLDGVGFTVDRLYRTLTGTIESFRKDGASGEGDGSLVAKLALLSRGGNGWDDEKIIANLMTAFIASTDTTSSVLCSTIQELIEDETGLQDELLDELRTKLPANIDDTTMEDLSKDNVPLLWSFLYEVLRFHAPTQFVLFHANEDIPFCGTTMKKGTEIFTLLEYCNVNPHHRPKNTPSGPNGEYEDHTKFQARRWLIHDKQNKTAYSCQAPPINDPSFMSFGYGPQRCVGEKFGMASLTYTLSLIVRTFHLAKAEGYTSPGRKLVLVQIPDSEICVALTKRE